MDSPNLKVLPVNVRRVVEGMEKHGDEDPVVYVLDTLTGKVFDFYVGNEDFVDGEGIAEIVEKLSEDERLAFETFQDGDPRFEEIPKEQARDCYQLMERFTEATDDERLGQELARAIRGAGAFRRFKDVLLDFPEQREKWFAFEAEQKQQWAIDWLESIGIRPATIECDEASPD